MTDNQELGCFIGFLVICAVVCLGPWPLVDNAANETCEALGWDQGATSGWFKFRPYCTEYLREENEFFKHTCQLPYVLAGGCEPMWTEDNDN